MRILRHYTGVPPEAKRSVVAIGNFDGVHLGHQAVVERARQIASGTGAPLAVVTFEPHPRSVLQPEASPFRLTPLRTKARHIERLGVDYLFVLHFDRRFSERLAQDFVIDALVEGLAVRHVVVGYDFVFGNRRRGNPGMLRRMAAAEGFGLTCVEPVRRETGEVCSSTNVRSYLQTGKPKEAARILGRCWEMEGRVERGDGRGAGLGYPTANIRPGEYLRPAMGIYAVRAGVDQGEQTVWRDGAASFGFRPTFAAGDVLLEVHLLDFTGDLYGKHLRVALVEYLREERGYDDVTLLKAQMRDDCARARAALEAWRSGGSEENGLGERDRRARVLP